MKQKKNKLTRYDTLKAIPLRNQAIKEGEKEEGEITLIVPRKNSRLIKIFSLAFRIPGERHISLDEIGTWVWRKCDGRTSVGSLIESLSGEFKISPKEAEISLLSFLKKMAQKKLIGFMINSDNQNAT